LQLWLLWPGGPTEERQRDGEGQRAHRLPVRMWL
jgi:hypothetical protein